VRLGAVAPRALLWDLDGVLVDSHEVWWELLRASAGALGGREVTRAAFEAGWGQGIATDVARWFPGRSVAELEAHYDAHFRDHAAHLRVDADAAGVIAAARARGLRQCLITNTPGPLARAILAHAKLELDAVVGGTDVPNAKPAPDVVHEACRRLGVAPGEAWVVGDTRFDRDAARAAGAPFVGVRTEGDARIERLAELVSRLP
jgi:HAD superfamily hydrolase (TIGR01509 family)